MISPSSTRIETLLSSSLRFVVPKFQRQFSWKETEAGEFIDDLMSYLDPQGGNLFLGTFIFDVSEEKSNRLIVVDGQQRITTIILLLVACREVAKALGEDDLVVLTQQSIAYVDKATGKTVGFRLEASKSIRQVLDYIADKQWDGKFPEKLGKQTVRRQVAKIKPIYEYFIDQLKDFHQPELSKFLSAIYQAYVVRIDIPNELEAFNIFERTNARGVELEVSDLVKNYLFKVGVGQLEERWDQIVRNSDGTLLRMLKYFYISKHGFTSKSQLYKKIKAYGEDVTPEVLVKEIEEFSEFYFMSRNADAKGVHDYFVAIGCVGMQEKEYRSDPVHASLEGLRLFKVSQTYPLIYAAIRCYMATVGGEKVNGEKLSEKLIHFFQLLERYHFINNAICERIGNEVEKPYADYSKEFAQSNDFEEVAARFEAELRKRRATLGEFTSRFVELSYSSFDDLPLIAYIFDRINNCGLKPGQSVSIYNPDKTFLRKNHNIEHFYPQNPNKHMTPDPETLSVVDNIGNLLAISLFVNTKLDNKSPCEKIALLKGKLKAGIQNMVYVQDFIESYGDKCDVWNKEMIKQRAYHLAQDSYSRVWSF